MILRSFLFSFVFLSFLFLMINNNCYALPSDAQVVSGQVDISKISNSSNSSNSNNVLEIRQNSAQGIIEWNTFNVAANEHVRFIQPSVDSVTLNRVVGSSGASIINGRVSANGNIMLINPDGILFDKMARIDVGGLVATTSNISNEDFFKRNFKFHNDHSSPLKDKDVSIINLGEIKTSDGGRIVLSAPKIENHNLIEANEGEVTLLTNTNYLLNYDGRGFLYLNVLIPGGGGEITNSGKIHADGGKIRLQLADADMESITKHVISMNGVLEADSVEYKNGEIFLSAGNSKTGGEIKLEGEVRARGNNKGEVGGKVQLLGNRVGLYDGSKIDVSGFSGGGDIRLGGEFSSDYRRVYGGVGPFSDKVYLSEKALLLASATDYGVGGRIGIWSDSLTRVYGSLYATGGERGGAGGFAEVSTKGYLDLEAKGKGKYDFRSFNGERVGELVIDPYNITISTNLDVDSNINTTGTSPFITVTATGTSAILSVKTLQDTLAGANVTVTTTSGDGGELGNITVSNGITWASAFSLTLSSYNNLAINAAISSTHASGALILRYNNAGGNTSATFSATSTISVSNSSSLSLYCGGANGATCGAATFSGVLTLGTFTANSSAYNLSITSNSTIGTSTFNNTGSLTLAPAAGTLTLTNGLSATTQSGVSLGGIITTTGTAVNITKPVTLLSATAITTNNGAISFGSTIAGSFSLGLTNGTAAVDFANTVNVGSLNVTGTTGIISIHNNITTTGGTQTYGGAIGGGPITLDGSNPTFSGTAITFNGTVNGAKTLTIDNTGMLTFNDIVGGSTALTSLNISGTGNTTINTTSITTSGAQTYGKVPAQGATTLTLSQSPTFTTTNNSITFNSSIVGSGMTLTTSTGSGAIVFNGSIGAVAGRLHAPSFTTTSTLTFGDGSGTDVFYFDQAISIDDPTNLAGTINTSAGAVSFSANAPVSLKADSTITTSDNTISFSSTINSPDTQYALTLNTNGDKTVTFGGAVGTTAALKTLAVNNGTGTTSIASSIYTTGYDQSYSGPASLTGTATLKGSIITFSSTLGGTGAGVQALTIEGNAVFNGIVGGTALKSLEIKGNTTINVGATSITTTEAQTYGYANSDKTTLNGVNPTFNSSASNGIVTFHSIIEGDVISRTFTISSGSGNIIFNGSIGSSLIPFNAPTLTTTGTLTFGNEGKNTDKFYFNQGLSFVTPSTVYLAGAINVSIAEDVSFTNGVDIKKDSSITIEDAGDIAFLSTVVSSGATHYSLNLSNTAATVDFQSTVGAGGSPLSSLKVSSVAPISIHNSITTEGTQEYDMVSLDDVNPTLTGSKITFNYTLNGGKILKISGDAEFKEQVGGGTPLTSLEVTGSTTINTIKITTTETQSYGTIAGTNTTTLSSNSTLKTTNFSVTFNSIINGSGKTLDVECGSGDVNFNGNVTVATLNFTGHTTGAVLFSGNTTITTLSSIAAAYNISFTGSTNTITNNPIFINGGTLTLGNGNDAFSFTNGLTVTSPTVNLAGTISNTATILFTTAVSITDDSSITTNDSDITFNSTVGSAANKSLTLDTGTATAEFKNTVGVVGGRLSSLSSKGKTKFSTTVGLSVFTNGNQTYGDGIGTDTITLFGINPAFDSSVNDGTVTFNSSIVGDAAGRTLNVRSDDGNVILNGSLGDSSRFSTMTITITGAGVLTLGNGGGDAFYIDSAIDLSGMSSVNLGGTIDTTSDNVDFSTTLNLNANSTITTVNGDITFDSTITSTGTAYTLTLNNGTEPVIFSGAVGTSGAPLGTLNVAGSGAITISGDVYTNTTPVQSAQIYSGPVTLTAGAGTRILKGSLVTFAETVDGNKDLKIEGSAVFSDDVGGTLISLEVTGSSTFNTDVSFITTTGKQTYGTSASDSTTFNVNPVINTTDAEVIFNSNVTADVANRILDISTGTENITFNASIGADNLRFNAPVFTTTGTLTFGNGTGDAFYFSQVLTIDDHLHLGGTIDTSAAAGTLSFTNTVDLKVNSAINTDNANIEFTQAISKSGDFSLEIDSGSGTVDFQSTVTAGSLNVKGTGAISIHDGISTTTTQRYNGDVTLNGVADAAIEFSGSTITFEKKLDNNMAVKISGGAVFNGVVGTTPLTSLEVTVLTTINTTAISTAGAQLYTGATTLSSDVGLTGGTITFSNTLASVGGLTLPRALSITGNAVFAGAVGTAGENARLASILVSGTTSIGASINTSGNQTYSLSATLTSDATLTGGTITFSNTLASVGGLTLPRALIIAGNAVFAGAVGTAGGNARLASILVNGGGITSIGASINTSGDQTYTGDATLTAGPITLTVGTVAFSSKLDGARALTISGNASFAGIVGTTALSSLQVTGDTSIANNITTTGTQSYGTNASKDASKFTANTTTLTDSLTLKTTNLNITFNSKLEGSGFTLTLNNGSGDVNFNGSVGAGGALSINVFAHTTPGTISFSDTVAITTLTTSANNYSISFTGSTNTISTFAEFLNTGTLTLGNGGGDSFTFTNGINASGPTAVNLLGTITTTAETAAVSFTNAVAIGSDITITTTNGSITFTSAVTASINNKYLKLYSGSGAVTFGSTVTTAAGTELSDLLVNVSDAGAITGSGTISIANSISSNGNQKYGGNVLLTGANATLAGGTIDFKGTINGNCNLTITGNANFAAAIGTTPLASLSVSGVATIGANVTTVGAQTYSGMVKLPVTGTITLTNADANNMLFASKIYCAGNGLTSDLILVNGGAGGGTATFSETVDVKKLTVGSGFATINIANNITTDNTQTYSSPTVLTGGALTTLAASTVTFANTLRGTGVGAQGLKVVGDASFAGIVGATSLANLEITGATSIGIGCTGITTSGNQTYKGATTLAEDVNLTSTAVGTINFQSTLKGAKALTITGAADFDGVVGVSAASADRLSSILVTAAASIGANIITSGNQTYQGATTINGDGISFTITDAVAEVNFQNILDSSVSARTLTINGNADFDGLVGNLVPNVTSLTVTGTTEITTNITTTGSQSYTGVVTLAGDTILTANTANNGSSVTFGSTLSDSGAFDLTVTTGAGIIYIKSNMTTAGETQKYNGLVVLTGNAIFTGSLITFANTLNATTAAAQSLKVDGNAVFSNVVGVGVSFSTVEVTGTSSIANNITTASTQTYTGAVTLTGDLTLTTTNNSGITFGSTVDGVGLNTETLNLSCGSGAILFTGNVGAGLGTALDEIAITSTGTVTFSNNLSATTLTLSNHNTGAVACNGDVSLTTLTTGPNNYNLSLLGALNTISGAPATPVTFSNTGELTLGNDGVGPDVFNFTNGLIASSPSKVYLASRINTTNAGATFGSAVVLNGNTLFSSNNNAVAFNNANSVIDDGGGGGRSLTMNCGSGTVNFAGVLSVGTLDLSGMSAGGSVSCAGNTTLTNITTAANNNSISFTASNNSITNLADFTNAGTLTLGNGGDLFTFGSGMSASGSTTLAANITATTGNVVFNGASTTLNSNTSITTSNTGDDITFAGTLDGAFDLSLTVTGNGDVTFNGAVGGGVGTSLTSLTINGASSTTNIGNNITTSGQQSYAGAALLTNDSTITGSNVRFDNTLRSSGANHTLAIVGNADFNGAVGGGGNSITSLTVSGTTAIGADVTTAEIQNYSGAVTLDSAAASVTLTTAGNFDITFGSTVNGARDLILTTTTGDIYFNNLVGTLVPLTSINVSSAGATTNIQYNITTTTTGNQTYVGPVSLSAASLATINLTGGTIRFDDVIGSSLGNPSLNIFANADFNGASISDITSLRVTGTSNIGATTINTLGSQTYERASILDPAGLTTTLVSNNSNINFLSSLDAGGAGINLRINSGSGDVAFTGAVGSNTALSSFDFVAAATGNLTFSSGLNVATFDLSNYTANSSKTFSCAGNLNVTTAFTTSANGYNISLLGTNNLITNAGVTTFTNTGSVRLGSTTFTNGLTIANPSSVTLAGVINSTAGAISLTNTTLSGATTLNTSTSNSNITFTSTIDGSYDLTLSPGSGVITLSGLVGSSSSLASLTVNGDSSSTNIPRIVSTSGKQNYAGEVFLVSDTVMTGETIIFGTSSANNLASTGASNWALTIRGNADFYGVVGAGGGTNRLTSLSVSGNSSIRTSAITTVGSQIYSGATTLDLDSILTANSTITLENTNSDINFGSTLNGSRNLIISNGVGSVNFAGAVGEVNALTSINITSTGDLTFGDNLKVGIVDLSNYSAGNSRSVSFNGNTTITDSLTLSTSPSYNLSLLGTTNTIAGNTVFTNTGILTIGDDVRDVSTFGGLTATAPSTIRLAGTINTTSRAINLTNTTLQNTTKLNSNGTNISFASTIDGDYDLYLNSGRTGDITFNGNVGSVFPLTHLEITSAQNVTIGQKMHVARFVQRGGSGHTFLGSSTLVASGEVYSNTSVLTGYLHSQSLYLELRDSCDIYGTVAGSSDITALRYTKIMNNIPIGRYFFNGIDLALAMYSVDNVISASSISSSTTADLQREILEDGLEYAYVNNISCQQLSWACDSFRKEDL
ncbi:MAG: filamentous hemagglutinin N-terminal domain-containing protein [Oligoflexia bacterium]|nr:filamentous hemagglutinin N-terminal domain-containing protein [Oligoflexia bacterium]